MKYNLYFFKYVYIYLYINILNCIQNLTANFHMRVELFILQVQLIIVETIIKMPGLQFCMLYHYG